MILDLSHFPKYLSLSTFLRSLCPVIGTSPPPLSVKKGALQKAQNKKNTSVSSERSWPMCLFAVELNCYE